MRITNYEDDKHWLSMPHTEMTQSEGMFVAERCLAICPVMFGGSLGNVHNCYLQRNFNVWHLLSWDLGTDHNHESDIERFHPEEQSVE